MIRLITGLPGAGKSLRAVQLIRQFLAEGRPVYVQGVDGLQPFGWEPCDARAWQDLPDGSVVVVDEAQKVWPTRRAGDPTPEIRALSEHRHRGFDFVLLTQHPTMLDKYVRTLVGEHQHILRQFGMPASRIITWTEAQDDPQSLVTRQRGTESLWKYPSECYALYKSATLHTVKRRIPFRVAIIPLLLVLVAGLGWWGYRSLSAMASTDVVPKPQAVAGPSPASAGGSSSEVKYATTADYLNAFLPRVAEQPWSAPAFDKREVRAEPELYCVLSEAKGCMCYTEQVTKLKIPERECLLVVVNGSYNPFRAPVSQQVQAPPRADERAQGQPARAYTALPVPSTVPDAARRRPMNAGSLWPPSR